MKVIKNDNSAPIRMFTEGVPVADNALSQLTNVAEMPFVNQLAVMPDVHYGKGATIGSVIATEKAIIPASVGVDIGCGMMAVKLDINADDLPDNLGAVRSEIEKAIPHGRSDHGGRNDVGGWKGRHPMVVQERWKKDLETGYERIIELHPKLEKNNKVDHLGTLGTGNHFVEMCLDLDDNVWVMLHSGSRGIGAKIGGYFIELAKQEMRRYFVNLPDKDLAYLPEGTEYFYDYMNAVSWAQKYALINRELMMGNALSAIRNALNRNINVTEIAVNCHHNYVEKEHHFGKNLWVTRKGAVRARKGDLGIIPGSMGAKSFIVRGKGNEYSLNSCSHGAGRVMSRTEAKKRFTKKDLAEQTKGVECRKDANVIDEIPGAYKNIDDVMKAQTDLVDVVAELRQVICVKG